MLFLLPYYKYYIETLAGDFLLQKLHIYTVGQAL